MEGIELSNQERIRMLREKENYKYLEILEVNIIKKAKIKRKDFLRRTRKLLKTKLCRRNLIRDKHPGSLQVRYSRPFLKWTREEFRQMDQRTRKLMTMH